MFDGSGDEPFVSDIGIKNQRIACIGNLSGATATRTLDARGLSLAPGFIDVHTHVERNVPRTHRSLPRTLSARELPPSLLVTAGVRS